MSIGNNIKKDKLIPEKEKNPEYDKKIAGGQKAKAGNKPPVIVNRQKVSIRIDASTLNKKGQGKNITVLAEGELTIKHINIVKQKLMDYLNKYKRLTIKFNNVNDLDLTCIQLMLAVSAYARKNNKNVSIYFDIPKELNVLLEHSGFGYLINKN